MPRSSYSKWLLAALLVLLPATANAQITIPNTFQPNTVAQSALVNANFSQLGNLALNRGGGVLTGNLVVNSGVTIDGVLVGTLLGGSGSPTFAKITTTAIGSQFGNAFTPSACCLAEFQFNTAFVPFGFYNSAAVLDSKWSELVIGSDGGWVFRFLNDAGSNTFDWLTVSRTAITSAAATIQATLTFSAIPTAPQITFSNSASNWIQWPTNGTGPPALTTRSTGTRLVLNPQESGTTTDYGLGIDTNVLWFSVPSTSQSFNWYAATTSLMTLTGTGNLTVGANLTVNNNLTVTGSTTLNGALTVANATNVTGEQNFTSALGNNGNISLNAGTTILRVTTTTGGQNTLTGFTGGADGREIQVCFVSAPGPYAFNNSDASSSSTNQIISSALPSASTSLECYGFRYDGGLTKWMLKF